MDSKQTGLIVIIIIILLILIVSPFFNTSGITQKSWQETYAEASAVANISQDYLKHDSIINLNPDIESTASSIANKSKTAKEAVANTLEYVYETVAYTRQSTLESCYDQTATDVFKIGTGDCVSMTKLDVSLLRQEGIAARPAGGCISSNFACGALFSINPGRIPKFEPVRLNDTQKRGGLHEWMEIWLPDTGWILGEATSGQMFPLSCTSYNFHDFNTDSIGICVLTDKNYIMQCARY